MENSMPTNAAMIAANAERFARAHIKPEWQASIDKTAARLVAPENKARFQAVEQRNRVAWPVVAIIKEREAGADPAFKLSIAQGDPWNAKSKHVPKGRGPFSGWDPAADDALMNCAPYAGRWQDWSVGGTLTILEKYNGTGYAVRGLPSPYIWSATTAYVKGKYVRDGVFDPNYVDQQIGCAALLLAMQKLDPSISFAAPGAPARPSASPPKEIVDDATKRARTVRKGAIAGGAAAGGNEAAKQTTGQPAPASTPLVPSVAAYSLLGVAVAIAIAATIIVARRKADVIKIW
jgi:lysozyme family protein